MNEKVNLQDLIDLLQKQQKMEQIDADAFVRAFWETIEEGLLNDGIVKVKGLGTFKLVGVEPRESINVNTGERFEIQQHSKITFMADSSMRNIINKPFAHFESVILNEGTVFDDIEENVIGAPDSDTQQSGETTEEDLSIAGTEVTSVSGPETSNVIEPEKPVSVSHSSVSIETSRTINEEVSDEREEDSLQRPEASTKLSTEVNGAASIDELDKTPICENKLSDFVEEGTVDEGKTLLNKVVAEVGLDKIEGNGIDVNETAVKIEEEEAVGYSSDSEQNQADLSENELSDSLQNAKAQQTEVEQERLMAETHSGSHSMNVSHHEQALDECALSPRKTTNKTMLYSFTIAVLFIVTTVCWVLFYVVKDNQNDGGRKKLEQVEGVVSEKETEEKLAELEDSIGNKVSDLSVFETDKLEPSVVTPIENAALGVKEKDLESGKALQKAESGETGGRHVVLTTRVKGQETLADTVEYEIVGVLGQEQIRPGDTLAKFAFKYYGNRRLWQYIAVYNKAVVKNPNNVPIGTVLKIPKLELKH